MNFAWTDRCGRDSSLMSDCELSFESGLSHGSVFVT